MLVERLVLVVGNIIPGARPQRGSLIDRFILDGDDLADLLPLFFFHDDGLDDVIRIFVDDGTNLVAAEQIILAGAQMQGDFRAARRLIEHLDGELPATIRFPICLLYTSPSP